MRLQATSLICYKINFPTIPLKNYNFFTNFCKQKFLYRLKLSLFWNLIVANFAHTDSFNLGWCRCDRISTVDQAWHIANSSRELFIVLFSKMTQIRSTCYLHRLADRNMKIRLPHLKKVPVGLIVTPTGCSKQDAHIILTANLQEMFVVAQGVNRGHTRCRGRRLRMGDSMILQHQDRIALQRGRVVYEIEFCTPPDNVSISERGRARRKKVCFCCKWLTMWLVNCHVKHRANKWKHNCKL